MIAWAALFWMLPLQDPGDDLKSQIDRLKAENASLQESLNGVQKEMEGLRKELEDGRERAASAEKQSIEDAKTIQRLRQALKSFEGNAGPAANPGKAPEAPPPAAAPSDGPVQPLRAKIEFVDGKMGFVVIDKGKSDGLAAGYRFEIIRTVYEGSSAVPRHEKLGVGEFEKFMGSEEGMSKVKILEGKASDMRMGDEAVAIRKLAEVPAAPPEAAPSSAKPGVFKITGPAGNGFALNYGSSDGARQTDVVYVYKDGLLKARLRLDTVQGGFSVGNVIDGTQVSAPETGDQVYTRELRKTVSGKIRINTEAQGILVDVGSVRDGVTHGQRFEVRRLGQKVGVIKILTPDKFHSYAKPDGTTKREDLQVGDYIELIEEK